MNVTKGFSRTEEFENDRVRIVRYRVEAHEKMPSHKLPNLVAVYLTNSNFRLTSPDGKVVSLKRKAGETEWLSEQEHGGENLDDTPLEFLAIELRDTPNN